MRHVILAALVAVSFYFCAGRADARVYGLTPRLVVLDPGHGGRDPGAEVDGVDEADVNLAVSKALAKELRATGVDVFVTRQTAAGVLPSRTHFDNRPREEMRTRAGMAQKRPFDAFLALHCNVWRGGGSARGAQAFVDRQGTPASVRLGEVLSANFRTGLPYARPLSRKIDHYLLKALADRTAVTVEMGFLTDPGEQGRLLSRDYQKQLARVMTAALVQHFTDVDGREAARRPLVD